MKIVVWFCFYHLRILRKFIIYCSLIRFSGLISIVIYNVQKTLHEKYVNNQSNRLEVKKLRKKL